MDTGRIVSLLGLGFGDCGKGLFTDYLCHRLKAHTVVRFNGGAQAGHTVVLTDGRHHTFSQLGAGTFLPGVKTVLAHPVVVHPTALLVEAAHLANMGVTDGLDRLLIDPRCLVTTPFHQAGGRLRELARASSPHGTCGVGVGETIQQGLVRPEEALCFGDLAHRARVLEKLEVLQSRIQEEFCGLDEPGGAELEQAILSDRQIPMKWIQRVQDLLNQLRPCTGDPLASRLQRPGAIIFEGAQGLLLDEAVGFHPHTTWSTPRPGAVESLVRAAGSREQVHHFGVLRSYLTRHGSGPLPTEDLALNSLPEPHNAEEGWQGRFRRGHADGVLLDYAMSAAGRPLDGLFLSHMDAFGSPSPLRWCESYEAPRAESDERLCTRSDDGKGRITKLHPSPSGDLDHQERLTDLLRLVNPHFTPGNLASPAELIDRVQATSGCSVRLISTGPVRGNVQDRNT